MFRKPRDKAALTPSTGRPPTPPFSTPNKTTRTMVENTFTRGSPTSSLLGQTKMLSKSNGRVSHLSVGKAKAKSNGSILNFFKKSDPTLTTKTNITDLEDESLFLANDSTSDIPRVYQSLTPPNEQHLIRNSPEDDGGSLVDEEFLRYNEEASPNKRRRIEISKLASPLYTKKEEAENLRKGPFIEDSDHEDGISNDLPGEMFDDGSKSNDLASERPRVKAASKEKAEVDERFNTPLVPQLEQESASVYEENDFQGIDDFIDDEFPEEGEEYLERKWMEEQRQFELGLEDEELEVLPETYDDNMGTRGKEAGQENGSVTCPICSLGFGGLTEREASIHVNNCLDGNSTSQPTTKQLSTLNVEKAQKIEAKAVPAHKRFQRAAIARPGQENPFGPVSNKAEGSSAFSKLMSSHAEDAAWATAAASESSSRGKPAYQRTCPFYKILPGFFICVDAFRYGAVEGCKAYFLSHFHSDHYIGLTSSWCHGPIYCSHVTANLVRRQLRVDPKWVFDLEFDHKLEVPETQGVEVTMIPANHCPGSSLYLFEKTIGKGKNPRVQRVLHCGDFRACPAHVQHPQLRPDIVDTVTGRNLAQQKLDVCYLDTTYLTPKYAFPGQEDVIRACADMCVSLSKDRVDENDSWEKTKKERAGSGMVKFVQSDSNLIEQEVDEDGVEGMESEPKRIKKARGRLLVIVGTYSIGKERICLGVARALNSKIYAPPNKQKICAALEDPELTARLTSDPLEAQVHMQMLMEIRAETLADYLTRYKPHFSRIVGFRPSGWNYRPPNSRFVESPAVQTVLHSDNWKSRYTMAELVPQRGSTREAHCFGVPYSEHSSFRELTMFCCALRIDKIIPTVNVGSAKSREKMKGWCEKWAMDKKKHGLFRVADGQEAW